jgi:predicted transcriptional regulator
MVLRWIYMTWKGGGKMQDKRVTIRIPFEIWKALRELQTVGKISSIQQAAVTGMDRLIVSLKKDVEDKKREAAKKRVLNILVKGKPLGSWEDIHSERTEADADRS